VPKLAPAAIMKAEKAGAGFSITVGSNEIQPKNLAGAHGDGIKQVVNAATGTVVLYQFRRHFNCLVSLINLTKKDCDSGRNQSRETADCCMLNNRRL
jgi:hypothetical protein